MRVKIKSKDTTCPVYYDNVVSFFQEGQTLALLFEDGKVRNFPMIHLWYYETEMPREKTKLDSDLN